MNTTDDGSNECVGETNAKEKRSAVGGDLCVQSEALKTLRELLERLPSEGLWRSVFPGCFAVSCVECLIRIEPCLGLGGF